MAAGCLLGCCSIIIARAGSKKKVSQALATSCCLPIHFRRHLYCTSSDVSIYCSTTPIEYFCNCHGISGDIETIIPHLLV